MTGSNIVRSTTPKKSNVWDCAEKRLNSDRPKIPKLVSASHKPVAIIPRQWHLTACVYLVEAAEKTSENDGDIDADGQTVEETSKQIVVVLPETNLSLFLHLFQFERRSDVMATQQQPCHRGV